MSSGRRIMGAALSELMIREPFWASVSYHVEKIASNSIPLMAVGFHGKGYKLIYNPEGLERMKVDHPDEYIKYTMGVIKHEFLHIVFDHVSVFTKNKNETKTMNIAMDLAINSFIADEIPETALIPGRGAFENYEPNLSFIEYYEQLKGDESISLEEFDTVHLTVEDLERILGEVDRLSPEEMEVVRRMIIDVATSRAEGEGWGTVSRDMQDKIRASMMNIIDWRGLLRRFIGNAVVDEMNTSFKRINRRYPWQFPGTRRDNQPKVAVSIDMSGSMSDEDLADIAGELNALSDTASFTVIPFDTEVAEEHIYEWRKGRKFGEIDRVACGGTDLSAPILYVDKSVGNFSAHIMFSDLHACTPPIPRVKTVFFVPEGGNMDLDHPSEKIMMVRGRND